MCLICLGFYCTTGVAAALVKAPFGLLRCREPFASSRNGAIKNLREINKYS